MPNLAQGEAVVDGFLWDTMVAQVIWQANDVLCIRRWPQSMQEDQVAEAHAWAATAAVAAPHSIAVIICMLKRISVQHRIKAEVGTVT